jgi:hypothetical protein
MTDKISVPGGGLVLFHYVLLHSAPSFAVFQVFCQKYSLCKILHRERKLNLRYMNCQFKAKRRLGHQIPLLTCDSEISQAFCFRTTVGLKSDSETYLVLSVFFYTHHSLIFLLVLNTPR